ncbi:MAG TPA: hypothetical protein VHR38_15645 [Solirubrobacterales bacterium]|jgi:hypothetical protein|nr:hypothetical protein [Solirubrobacterales bacterium]
MNSAVDELVRSLLFEGYALYPYTPGVKNATPTPFGIAYPPEYSEAQPAAFSMLRLEAVLQGGPDARLSGTVLFLQATGERHEAAERELELGPATLAQLAREPVRETFSFPMDDGELRGRIAMRAEVVSPDLARVRLCVHNETGMSADPSSASRGDALRHSLISTHPLLEVEGGRFASPLEREGPEGEAALASESVNTFPVLLGEQDRAVLGAAIMLPDHPELAPESLGNLFDNTEIEEALLLHVHALSEDERAEIAGQDPAVREMIERAESTTAEDIMGLHGRLTYTEPEADQERSNGRPPSPPPGLDEIQGEREIAAAGTTVRLGDKIVLRPGTEGDVYDKILHGRTATVERIYRGYDERIYLGVTVDDDPGQDLLRETGRFLFFFADEVEPAPR